MMANASLDVRAHFSFFPSFVFAFILSLFPLPDQFFPLCSSEFHTSMPNWFAGCLDLKVRFLLSFNLIVCAMMMYPIRSFHHRLTPMMAILPWMSELSFCPSKFVDLCFIFFIS